MVIDFGVNRTPVTDFLLV